ncbi:hypothetical protein ACNKHL_19755 [Shigella flexneri]
MLTQHQISLLALEQSAQAARTIVRDSGDGKDRRWRQSIARRIPRVDSAAKHEP